MVVGNPSNPTMIGQAEYAVEIDRLDFAYPQSLPTDEARMVLNGFSMQLKPGSRCLLLGANGSGKSTLLKLLAGKHLWGMRTVAFAGYGCPLQADIRVGGMMRKLQGRERRDELVKILGVDPEWRMHRVSDGQRRRVQLLLGLVRPFDILLLDEVTTCLDVIVRQDLLLWLQKECEVRGATVLYATHIFDGLDDWPTHIHYLNRFGKTGWQGEMKDLDLYTKLRKEGHPSPLLKIATTWLRAELAEFGPATEGEDGDAANDMKNPNTLSTDRGGFNPGRPTGGAAPLRRFAPRPAPTHAPATVTRRSRATHWTPPDALTRTLRAPAPGDRTGRSGRPRRRSGPRARPTS
ncbi:ATPase [Aureococcus anophagefferens]|nr:ATPase [Aureococcus anophagefferens]